MAEIGYGASVYPDDTRKDLAAVLSYLAGRPLSREEIWTAMALPRSTFYDQLDKGTLITADNLCTAARNLGINRAELLTRYRFIDPEEVAALADEIRGHSHLTDAAPRRRRRRTWRRGPTENDQRSSTCARARTPLRSSPRNYLEV